MSSSMVMLPLLAQALLTLGLYPLLLKRKKAARAAGLVDEQRAPLDEAAWPDPVRQVNNCINNQFASPVLFYVLVLALHQLGAANGFTLLVGCAYVASRYVHAWVHVGSNYVPHRRNCFALGIALLLLLAGQLGVTLL
ncbi:MAPEG family protein [Atopomonas sediminilitoris]|uniref:MAPEG family protein n=1 Tax=Atopomonas sediminilitoris TaxID=2919919 RepID=UPI001F4E8278|nr:MAPEG family protein [Atopomonas sediminilitoris]MCJ8168783.1 MAPEG family protein [Atopomonas sediminilitoris]